MSDFEIKITTDAKEIQEAQQLRFQVFNLEMGKGLQASYERGLDVDDFDPFCDHLIVRDAKNGEVVGTYRLLRGSQAKKNIGFYSEREFNLDKIKKLDGELLELGRSCARKDFRDRALIPLMWEAIAHYVEKHHVRFLFGCASLYTTEAEEVSEYFSLLKQKYYADETLRVHPIDQCQFEGVIDHRTVADEHGLFLKLPSLLKGYLRLGAVVCGPPALDREFGTADFLLLLDMHKLSSDYLRRFGLVGSKVQNAVG
ncbi:MAG TPA: GNAT family N-acyltransferase [Candidatus Udaeobacter sp.]|jgi:putative hemolysin|nr:GNAT family N-acyltransferase [Candidatus Udaeobacter sp.]